MNYEEAYKFKLIASYQVNHRLLYTEVYGWIYIITRRWLRNSKRKDKIFKKRGFLKELS